ncbi:hypothetical protein GCM10007036_38550 [Alsobacter metallidurans]|uniref:Flagellar hook-length control protein-like C-terminal domain-containing protein n=1 Tax=Alsobacter metallidurans TaxID=340221 RepID=A0A917IAV6_9HYPH|nr:hypothetical protein GCM10007036_38550 [Alsobacter metallidurans]
MSVSSPTSPLFTTPQAAPSRATRRPASNADDFGSTLAKAPRERDRRADAPVPPRVERGRPDAARESRATSGRDTPTPTSADARREAPKKADAPRGKDQRDNDAPATARDDRGPGASQTAKANSLDSSAHAERDAPADEARAEDDLTAAEKEDQSNATTKEMDVAPAVVAEQPQPAPQSPEVAAESGVSPPADPSQDAPAAGPSRNVAVAQPTVTNQVQLAGGSRAADTTVSMVSGGPGRRTAASSAAPGEAKPAAKGEADVEAADDGVTSPPASADPASGQSTGSAEAPGQAASGANPQADVSWTQIGAGLPAALRDSAVQAPPFGTAQAAAPVAPVETAAVHGGHAAAFETLREAAKRTDKIEAAAPGETFHAMVFDVAQMGSAGRVAAHGAPQDVAQTGADLRAAQQAPAIPVSAVPIEIGMRALAGAQSFQIRLHPEEYGRVDVKLDISDDGSVSAQISTDRVEALTMLQRDAKTLERAFEQAGLKTNENSLQFSLNNSGGENAARDQAGREQQQHRRSPASPTPEPKAIPADLAAALRSIRTGATGLDIQI